MERGKLRKKIKNMLNSTGMKYIEASGLFDFIIKSKNNVIFVKLIANIDSITENTAKKLINISYSLNSYSIVVGSHTRVGYLKDEIIYKRFGVPCMNIKTFEEFIKGNIPNVESFRGGEFVYIDPIKLRNARMKRGFTQEELADIIGVSKKCIYEHEKMLKKAKVEIANMISNALNSDVISTPEIKTNYSSSIEPKATFTRFVYKYFSSIGIDVNYVDGVSFNIVAKNEQTVLTYAQERIKNYKVEILRNISNFLKKPALVISKDPVDVEIPNISKRELEDLNKKKFKKIVKSE